jgi:hypothetical protein
MAMYNYTLLLTACNVILTTIGTVVAATEPGYMVTILYAFQKELGPIPASVMVWGIDKYCFL